MLVASLVEAWQFPGESATSPAVAYSRVFVATYRGSGSTLRALDAASGTQVWSFTPRNTNIDSSPAVADRTVYFGTARGKVYAFDAFTGARRWRFSANGGIPGSPVVSEGRVYIGSRDHNLYALDATTGTELWRFRTGKWVYSTPAVADEVVFVGSDDHKLYALDAASGGPLWHFNTGFPVDASPAVADGRVFIGAEGFGEGAFFAVDAATGQEIWRFLVHDRVSSPSVANGVVFVATPSNLYALDAATGEQLWTFSTGYVNAPVYINGAASPAVANGVVYLRQGNDVHALDAATGEELWSLFTGGSLAEAPAIADGVLHVCGDPAFLAFRLTGTEGST